MATAPATPAERWLIDQQVLSPATPTQLGIPPPSSLG
jgi:hypothetical protein